MNKASTCDANTLLAQNPITVLYVATVLAHRLDGANHALIQLKHQLQTDEPHSVVAKTVSKMEGILAVGGAARSLGSDGQALADAILGRCEQDLSQLRPTALEPISTGWSTKRR
jgi:hypothetical protein